MIGHATLAWTVIVQYVTETQPALLHVLLPNQGLVWGLEKQLCR
jgi:hypothetical protein